VVLTHDDANDVLTKHVSQSVDGTRHLSRRFADFHVALPHRGQRVAHVSDKRQKEQVSLSDDEADVAKSLADDPYFDGDELQARLQAAIARLPEKAAHRVQYEIFSGYEVRRDERRYSTPVSARSNRRIISRYKS